jgi:hypothetical protein
MNKLQMLDAHANPSQSTQKTQKQRGQPTADVWESMQLD